MATVRAQAEVTHRKLKKPEHQQAIREMIRAIDESSRSAGQMLDHAMVTFRADTLAQDEIDLAALSQETVDRLAPTADLKDINIRLVVPQEQAIYKGDHILLQAALMNMLDNAIKYSPEESEIVVTLDLAEEITLSVRDQGRGFGDMDPSIVTERYRRGENVGNIVGSGLGLTIADDVIRAHNGRLDIRSNQEGAGACVSLVLPR